MTEVAILTHLLMKCATLYPPCFVLFLLNFVLKRLPLPSGHLSALSPSVCSLTFPLSCMRTNLYHKEYMDNIGKPCCLFFLPCILIKEILSLWCASCTWLRNTCLLLKLNTNEHKANSVSSWRQSCSGGRNDPIGWDKLQWAEPKIHISFWLRNSWTPVKEARRDRRDSKYYEAKRSKKLHPLILHYLR